MDNQQIKQIFEEYIKETNIEAIDAVWVQHNKKFRKFWSERILNVAGAELGESEMDEIIRILDRNGKGNTKDSEAVAKAMIAQGVWRRMFKQLKSEPKLGNHVNAVFVATSDEVQAKAIDALYKYNDGKKNNLTGKSGNAINAMLVAYDATKYSSIISLKDRQRVIEFFNFPANVNFEADSQGKKMVYSNQAVTQGFRSWPVEASVRVLSKFLYLSRIKEFWKAKDDTAIAYEADEQSAPNETTLKDSADPALFYMEKQLEDFLIENWDKTELGQKYDLIEEDGEMVSQQYQTDIGIIDILVQDKKTKQLVVIELKKDQSSDTTIGQLARYMGYLEEKKTGGKATKGIIVSSRYDEKLYYALKKVKDIEVYLYRVDFKLQEFKAS